MKTRVMKVSMLFVLMLSGASILAQINLQPELQFYRLPGYDGLNIFETPKANDVVFDGVKVRMGGDFALQFQALSHSNDLDNLIEIGSNVNLPTANLNLDAQLADGVRMHLRIYLSSRHHTEAWVKGGYIQIDKLDFVKQDFLKGFMDIATFRIGVDQINYGDAHFRRTDNAMAIYNPFVGNYLMDAFTTEPFFEINVLPGDWIIVGGISNGYLNPTVQKTQVSRATGNVTGTAEPKVTFYGKLGWDSQINDDTRVRITGSFYNAPGYDNGDHLYGGDRAGSRYYNVMDFIVDDGQGNTSVVNNDFSGRINPRFSNETAFQINPFVKWKAFEFFGIYEMTSGLTAAEGQERGSYTQIGAELIYRFGSWDQLFFGGRYNSVSGYGVYPTGTEQPTAMNVNRINIGGGWFLTKNTLLKIEYVTQTYDENFSGALMNGNFSGAVLEAVIGL